MAKVTMVAGCLGGAAWLDTNVMDAVLPHVVTGARCAEFKALMDGGERCWVCLQDFDQVYRLKWIAV
jgi:hypothetical protein